MKTPPVPNDFETSVVPSGLNNAALPPEIVTPLSWTLTSCPTAPENVNRAFWPGTVVVTVTDDPPATIAPATSGAAVPTVDRGPPAAALIASLWSQSGAA